MTTANTVAVMNSADRDMKQGKAKGDWAFQARSYFGFEGIDIYTYGIVLIKAFRVLGIGPKQPALLNFAAYCVGKRIRGGGA